MKKSVVLLSVMACIFAMFRYPSVMINPGQLLEGHKKIKDDCSACHVMFKGISSEKCISCHKLSEIGMKDIDSTGADRKSTLFHQNLSGQECTACHTDHLGANPEKSYSGFTHEMISNDVKNNCSSCHKAKEDTLHSMLSKDCSKCHNTDGWKPADFNHDMLQVAAANCLGCHKMPADLYHEKFTEDCSQCHSTDKWKPSTFDHSKYFLLDKKHNAVCITCHTNNNYGSYTCYGCHEHSESKIAGEHREEGIYNFSNCASCHKSGNEHDIKIPLEYRQGNESQDKSGSKKKEKKKKSKEDDDD